ncbi:hybrid sensor histidine kinase/response regulator [Variovorax sp. JS1663]|uniref:hybrid sensor histidine kinase/response regulator n=1 Tax=Variovorax sp. JS1663 TaxID=1851577 RepID=UPI000B342DF8|nr:Hpt domain-containing protein [Variovorax sp. JS1663]OUL99721.1 hybrid sensor histidine kinase/response regulator [Variovorax sp. JS1663]
MSTQSPATAPRAGHAPVHEDLGPLAWVLGEIQKSLDNASKTLKRFARESGGSEPDTAPLRLARQQLHQAVGALQMVGHSAPALVLGAMEFAVQSFVAEPVRCTDAAAQKIDRAGFAVADFLNALLAGKTVSSVALFPQYRDVLELVGNERVHPADLWDMNWRWAEIKPAPTQTAMVYDPAVRSKLDREVLKIVKNGDDHAARRLQALCLSLGRGASVPRVASFWTLAAGFFEALALALIPADAHVKRAASRVLLQYATLARGDNTVSDRLGQDLLFFCAQAVPGPRDEATTLRAVRVAWGVVNEQKVDYTIEQFGRFDPQVLTQARKRIETAKEMWSALSGGDVSRTRQVADTFAQLGESLQRLHPPSQPMVQALNNAVDASMRSGRPPGTELAMEVATSVLYLEAAFEDLDPHDRQLTARTVQLAGRIERARDGGRSEPLEPWMEELYRRVSDRQTMGTVVGELRSHLGELEKSLDQFFRRPSEKGLLRAVPTQLLQMKGVFSVLGLDQAAQTVQRMRDNVDRLLAEEPSATDAKDFDALGNNLGALGFLIDMLSYQPALAKRLFVFDAEAGELKPLMGRQAAEAAASDAAVPSASFAAASGPVSVTETVLSVEEVDAQIAAKLAALATPARKAPPPPIEEVSRPAASWTAKITGPAPLEALPDTEVRELEEDDLQNIFLDEAREVLHNGLAAVSALGARPDDNGELTVLRRAFHTLKGSSRMVGLMDFGEAAWSFEQVLNTWLADQRPATPELLAGTRRALTDFAKWVEAIAGNEPHGWQSAPFRSVAEALRTGEPIAPPAPVADADALVAAARHIAAEESITEAVAEPEPEPVAVPEPQPLPLPDLPDLELGPLSFDVPDAAAPTAPATQPLPTTPEPAVVDDEFAITDFLDFEARPKPQPEEPLLPAELEEVDFLETAHVAIEPALSLPVAEPEPDALPSPLLKAESQEGPALAEPLPEFSLELRSESALEPEAVAEPQAEQLPPEEHVAVQAVEAAEAAPAEALPEFEPELPGAIPEPVATALAERPAVPGAEDQVKVIGPLRIGIALYNVYLVEADEWSRQLANEVGEWALESQQRVPESTINLAHSLAGSSATVGFQGLSDMARSFEAALQHLHMQGRGTPAQGAVLVAAAEELRRLLHQFAAGFLKEPAVATLQALREVAESPMPAEAGEVTAAGAAPLQRFGGADVALDESEDAIDVTDAVDVDLFPVFEEEAAELLPQLGAALREWSQHPDDPAPRASTLRTLHTLKGSARLAGAMRLGERAHRMESEIEAIAAPGADRGAVEQLLTRFDALQATFDALRVADDAMQAELAQRVVAPAPAAAAEPQIEEASVSQVDADAVEAPAAAQEGEAPQRPAVALPSPSALTPLRPIASQAVRIRTHLLDRLVAQAGEVIITRSRLEAELSQLRGSLHDLTGNLDRLRQQLRDIEVQAESQMQSRLAQAKDSAQAFDPLEFDRFTRVQELTRMMAESVNDVATVQRTLQKTVQATEDDLSAQARQTRELQRGLLRTRMVEFEGISERLYRVVRQASKDTGKQVRLDIVGGTIEMDRGVLDRMTPAFEHLLRNCVAHGIEDAQAREQAGKDASGLIAIELHHEGNDVSVSFRDDGAGLNHARIVERARALGLVAAGHQPSEAEAAELIFTPGFSTAEQVSELAGRGIGMDVVRAQVAALGGRIETRSKAGEGTEFKLVLPLTTAVTHVVMLRAGANSVGVPSNLVELVQRASGSELDAAYQSQRYAFGGEQVPFFWAGALLQSSARSDRGAGKTNTVVIVRSAAQRVALHVDEVLGNQEVVVKNLGPQLSRLPGMAGISVLASGAVALIYNPVALAAVHGEQARQLQAGAVAAMAAVRGTDTPAVQAPPQIPLVLVVDDSITVRRVTQRLLQREGYRVALAADGLQALERLQQERPTVVLSDIEMPRMDGFDLARNIRADASLADLPIIMITSRIAEKHHDHARALGVNHYLGKPYSEEELLRLVRHYASAETPQAMAA